MSEPTPPCTCLPLNRALMAHLLKVMPGSVHEQGCVERVQAEARAAVLRELAGPLRELAAVLNATRSDGPVMDTLVAEGPWWTPPDPTGVRLYDAIIGSSKAVDAVLAAIDRKLKP